MSDLNLEQSEARRLQAESEAEQLRAQMQQEREASSRKEAMAALNASASSAGEIAALHRQITDLRSDHDQTRNKIDTAFGENGLTVNGGVTHGTGDRSTSTASTSTLRVYSGVEGVVHIVELSGRVVS